MKKEDEANISGDTNEADLTADDVLQNELRSLNVQGDSWTVTNDKKFHQVYIALIISSGIATSTI